MACSADYFIIDNEIFPTNKFDISELEKGISIYEVVKVIDSTPLFTEEHIKRLHESAKIKNLKVWTDDTFINEQVEKLIKINSVEKGRLKFALRYDQSGNKLICFYLQSIEPKVEVYKKGVKIISENIERVNPNAKVINYKLRKLVKKIVAEESAFETLLVSKTGKITECSKSNIFFIKGNKVYTSHSKDVLKGITRKYIFNICKENIIPIVEKDIYLKDISNFDSVFITGTSIGVLSVYQIDNIVFSKNNSLLKLISDSYFEIVSNYIIQKK